MGTHVKTEQSPLKPWLKAPGSYQKWAPSGKVSDIQRSGQSERTIVTIWHANIDANTEDNEANDCQNLDNRKNELGFTITSNTEEVDADNKNEEERDPYTRIDRSGTFPVG